VADQEVQRVKAVVLVGGFDGIRLRPLTKDEMRAKARGVISAADRVLEALS
jgi:hypothetical protein